MNRILCLSLSLLLLWPAFTWAGSSQCAKYQVSLEGVSVKAPGCQYKNITEMHKVDQTEGYDGLWKIDRILQVIESPSGGAGMELGPMKVELGNGVWMMCQYQIVNNVVIADCTDGNHYIDVYKNRIGSKAANVWVGSIQGRQAQLHVDPSNPLAPILTGEIRTPEQRQLDIDIVAPATDRFAFNDQETGVLEMEFRAKVTPSEYEGDVIWSVPEIEGSRLTLDPPSGKGPTLKVRYEGLPRENSQFGSKTVKALVNVGGCKADDSKLVKVFFDRDAKNNPGGEYPNWFYYWKQTPAGKPRNQDIVLEYGGTSFDLCSQENVPALYKPGAGHATIHVCNLSKLGLRFPITYPILTLQPPYFKGFVTSTQIDSFAVAVRHEFEHWQIDHNYRFGKSDAEIEAADTDQDGLPDSVEPQYGFDPTKKQTFLSTHSSIQNIGEDEEWLAYMSMSEIAPGSLDKFDWARPGKQWP